MNELHLTATQVMRDQEVRDQRMLEQHIEAFMRAWAPQDSYDRNVFEGQFHTIVRLIYREAQAPLLDHITKIAMATPFAGASLLRPASSPPPLPTDPVRLAEVTRKNADYHRDVLRPFA